MLKEHTMRLTLRAAMTAVLLLACACGCSDSTDLNGTPLTNSKPDTRLTGHPVPLEASFAVDLKWVGYDSDGEVMGYEWKVSNNGADGISPRDTLTVDPLTGAVINPWHFTTRTDTSLVLLADQPGFPGDDPANPRSFRTHSMFIRAVDDKGAVDSTPAMLTFNSTTVVPTVRVVFPLLHDDIARNIPATVNLAWEGTDPDFKDGMPTQVRYLWRTAKYDTNSLGEPKYIRTGFEYNQHFREVLDFDDPAWSPWRGFGLTEGERNIQFSHLPDREYFLFALQVRDTAGAVSVGMGYQKEVVNVRVVKNGFKPKVTLVEPRLGEADFAEEYNEIASGQMVNFSWAVTAEEYNGVIVSCRHGWDLLDIDDQNDDGWSVPPGLSSINFYAREVSFYEGFHTFYLRVEDDAQQVRFIKWGLFVEPPIEE
jgi:hypothetical protein